METQAQQQERIAAKAAAAKWPESVPVPDTKPKLKLSGKDGNAFSILGRARRKAEDADWTDEQIEAFTTLATAGNYDHVLQTCIQYFDVS